MSTHVLGGTGLSPTPSSHSSSTSNTTERSFADLGATPTTLTSLARIGVEHPFPIQTLCLPLALAGVDLIGQARTGTGKTLAFGIPIVQDVDPSENAVQALIVVPTRELCLQVAADISKAGHDAGVRVAAIVGGRPMGPQIVDLNEGAPVVVGTPGRLLDHLRQGSLQLDALRVLVLDEADRGLDIAGLSHVINYDTPEDERAYVHRIGRTGRAGAAGVAITFVAWNEAATADLIRQHLGLAGEPIPEVYSTSQMLVDLFDLPTVEEAAAKRAASHPAAAKAKAKAAASASGDEEATQATRTSGSRRRRRRRLAGPRTDASTAAVAG